MTRQGGFRALESQDGRHLYFSKHDSPGIWSLPLPQETPRMVTGRLPLGHWGNWLLQGEALIFYDPEESRPRLTRLHLPSGRETHLTWLPSPPTNPGLALTPDGMRLLIGKADRAESDIILLENAYRVER